MQIAKALFPCILSFYFIFLPDNLYSQKHFNFGLLGQFEKSNNAEFRFIGGISLSKMISSNFEIELEVAYRTIIDSSLTVKVPVPPNFIGTVRFHLKHKFLTIPLLFGYKSKIVNFSVGPTLDIFLGWNNTGYSSDPWGIGVGPISPKFFDNDILWGMKLKVSKTIKLSDYITLEPYIFMNPIFTKYSFISGYHSNSNQFWGFALPIKFKILY